MPTVNIGAAQAIPGICYLEGNDAEADYLEAFRLLSAAAQGSSRAVVGLARMYAVPEAIRLYKTIATAEEFLAQIQLGPNVFPRAGRHR
jgi:TPR repeat protein